MAKGVFYPRSPRQVITHTCDFCPSTWTVHRLRNSKDGKKRCPTCRRRKDNVEVRHFLRYKDFSEEKFTAMLTAQEGVCAICKTDTAPKRLNVDHDHVSGDVRGLLCINCNWGLGQFRDSVELLQDAINYLKKANKV